MDRLIAIIKRMYVLRVEKKATWKKDHMVMNTFFQIVKYSVFITVLVGCWMLTTPAVKSLIDYGMENFTTYSNRIDSLSKSVENSTREITTAILESMKSKKNPNLDGITIEDLSGVISVYPSSYNTDNDKKWLVNKLQDWVESEGYDGVIFGDSYTGLNGTIYWCDGTNATYDTDMELIISVMEKKCKKIFSFIENMPEHRIFPRVVKNYIVGYINIDEYQKYRFRIWGYNFIRTDTPKTISAKNFNIEIVGSDITTLIRPDGYGNDTVTYDRPNIPLSHQVKDTIKDITDLL